MISEGSKIHNITIYHKRKQVFCFFLYFFYITHAHAANTLPLYGTLLYNDEEQQTGVRSCPKADTECVTISRSLRQVDGPFYSVLRELSVCVIDHVQCHT